MTVIVPVILEEVRTRIIPDVIQRLNETSDVLEAIEQQKNMSRD